MTCRRWNQQPSISSITTTSVIALRNRVVDTGTFCATVETSNCINRPTGFEWNRRRETCRGAGRGGLAVSLVPRTILQQRRSSRREDCSSHKCCECVLCSVSCACCLFFAPLFLFIMAFASSLRALACFVRVCACVCVCVAVCACCSQIPAVKLLVSSNSLYSCPNFVARCTNRWFVRGPRRRTARRAAHTERTRTSCPSS